MIRASSTSSRPLNCDAAKNDVGARWPDTTGWNQITTPRACQSIFPAPNDPSNARVRTIPFASCCKERKELIRVYFRRLVPVFTNHPELDVFQKARREVLTLSARDGIYNWLRNWLRTRDSNPEPCG